MKKIFCIYFNVCLFLIGNFSPLGASTEGERKSNINSIGLEYLNYNPVNDYILGPGDELVVSISRDLPDLESRVIIDGEGTIYLPRLKRIYVSGLSVNELNNTLNEAFKKYVKNPSVETLVVGYRSISVTVEGEVSNPGMIFLLGAVSETSTQNKFFFPTVFDAIREAGGITEFSDITDIKVIRKNNLSNGGGKIIASLNFDEVLNTNNKSNNIRIYDSDVIRINRLDKPNNSLLKKASLSQINKKTIDVFVVGRVKVPGNTKVSSASVLTDSIAMAGGTKVLSGPLTFIRIKSDGTIDKRKFGYKSRAKRGSYKNPYLKEGDLIILGDSLFSSSSEVISEITSPFTGIFSTYALFKAFNEL
ncbi:MAG: polysaccharide biosynthesis/export family protein [Prochlorococcus marinus XMU1428]|nr:polysaccharide biosynthesis/export family protein [Prochlorococcus marinus XMU1428]